MPSLRNHEAHGVRLGRCDRTSTQTIVCFPRYVMGSLVHDPLLVKNQAFLSTAPRALMPWRDGDCDRRGMIEGFSSDSHKGRYLTLEWPLVPPSWSFRMRTLKHDAFYKTRGFAASHPDPKGADNSCFPFPPSPTPWFVCLLGKPDPFTSKTYTRLA